MNYHKTILILEDNLHVLSILLEKLYELEDYQSNQLSVMVLTNSNQVKEYINNNPEAYFDAIILDRDCKLNKSFHVLNFERLGVEKVVSISSVEEYNNEAMQRGVKRVVLKNLRDLHGFAEAVAKEVAEIIR